MSTLVLGWRASCIAAEARQCVFPVPNGPYISKGAATLLLSHLPRIKFKAICCLLFISVCLVVLTGTQQLLSSGRTVCRSVRWSTAWCIWQNHGLSNWNWTSISQLVSFFSCSSDTHFDVSSRTMWLSSPACLNTNASYTRFVYFTDSPVFAVLMFNKAVLTPRFSISPSGVSGVSEQETLSLAHSLREVKNCDAFSSESDASPQTFNLEVKEIGI